MKALNSWLKYLGVCKVPVKVSRARTVQGAWAAAREGDRDFILRRTDSMPEHDMINWRECPRCHSMFIKKPPAALLAVFRLYQQRIAKKGKR